MIFVNLIRKLILFTHNRISLSFTFIKITNSVFIQKMPKCHEKNNLYPLHFNVYCKLQHN